MQNVKSLAILLWFVTLALGFLYSRQVIEPDGTLYRVSFQGFGLLLIGLITASVVFFIKIYRHLRMWLHQQGILDRSTKIPIRWGILLPFLICFFSFAQTSKEVVEGVTIQTTYGWGSPSGAFCFLFFIIFFTLYQIYMLLKRYASVDER